MSKPPSLIETQRPAVLDSAHTGDITGALGTIRFDDVHSRRTFWHRVRTLAAILGPGLIVMVADNDAGGVATYAQAGQNYGTTLLWTLLILIPVLIINQEMAARLGAVTGVGHARLIKERFGRFWGWFSVGDLFILNFLTIITEFIGVSLALGFFGVRPTVSVPIAAAGLILMTVTGSFRRWERFMFVFLFASLLFIPLVLIVHPTAVPILKGTFVPGALGGLDGKVVLLIVAIVGTTVAPWQLFFQQSSVIDKGSPPAGCATSGLTRSVGRSSPTSRRVASWWPALSGSCTPPPSATSSTPARRRLSSATPWATRRAPSSRSSCSTLPASGRGP
jgi:Mn2+/Fe2+ NRAMP family transporter